MPILYLHPYELFTDYLFYVNKNELKDINIFQKYYWILRQYQWHKIGNKSVIPKIENISKNFIAGGTVDKFMDFYD